MAIGKVNAYATVQPINIDYGDIALDAQKMQQAANEQIKDLMPKPEPPVDPYKMEGTLSSSTVSAIDTGLNSTLNEFVNELASLTDKKRRGVITSEEEVRASWLEKSAVPTLSSLATNTASSAKKYAEEHEKYSGASGTMSDFFEGLTRGISSDMYKIEPVKSNNSYNIRVPLIQDGKQVVDEKGNKIWRKYVDKNGDEHDFINSKEIEGGYFFDRMPKAWDSDGYAKGIINDIKLKTEGSDTGIVKTVQSVVTPEIKASILESINANLKDKDKLIDILYKVDPKEYANPKKQYTEEDIQKARTHLTRQIDRGLGTSVITDVDLGAKISEDQWNQNKTQYTLQTMPTNIPEIKNLVIPGTRKIVAIRNAKPVTTTVQGIVGDKPVVIPAGSIPEQYFIGRGNKIVMQVSVPTYKSKTFTVGGKEFNIVDALANQGNLTTDEQLALSKATQGAEYKSKWIGISEAAAANIIDEDLAKKTFNSQKFKKQKTQTGSMSKYNKK